MKAKVLLILLFVSSAGCKNLIDYSLDGTPTMIELSAVWSAADSEHVICLAASDAYSVSEIKDTAEISCFVNGKLAAKADSVWREKSRDGTVAQYYRIRLSLHSADSVALKVSLPGHSLEASAIVPPVPKIRIDTTLTGAQGGGVPYRQYDLDCTVEDIPDQPSYYRLYTPTVTTGFWLQIAEVKTGQRFWPVGPEIDGSDPVFKNVSFYFPEVLSRDMTFIHSGLSNRTNIFPDDSFEDSHHTFTFQFDQNLFCFPRVDKDFFSLENIDFESSEWCRNRPEEWLQDHYDWFLRSYDWMKFRVDVRVASLSREEYMYLIAYNAAKIASVDPLSEPVVLPSNVTGGLGFFAIENVAGSSIETECKHLLRILRLFE